MLGAHLLGLVAVAIAVSLGLWQYGSWQDRRAAEALDLTEAAPIPLADALGPDDRVRSDQVGQPVEIDGAWVPDSTVFISGRERDGDDGYWVVTALDSGAAAMPVVRGWTSDAAAVPAEPTGRASVVGWLQSPEGAGRVDDDPTDDVFPELRVADLVQRVDADMYYAFAVSQEGLGGLAAADLEELPPIESTTALKNLLYALEWWAFGLFAAFIWWRFVRDSRTASSPVRPVPSRV